MPTLILTTDLSKPDGENNDVATYRKRTTPAKIINPKRKAKEDPVASPEKIPKFNTNSEIVTFPEPEDSKVAEPPQPENNSTETDHTEPNTNSTETDHTEPDTDSTKTDHTEPNTEKE